MTFRHVYIQAKEGKNKYGKEFKIDNDHPLKRYDLITFAVTTPKENAVGEFSPYHLDGRFNLDKVTLDDQKELMKAVLASCLKFAGANRIHSISYSFDPDDIRDVVILIKFLLLDSEEGPPASVVYDRIRFLTEEKFSKFDFGAARNFNQNDYEDESVVESF